MKIVVLFDTPYVAWEHEDFRKQMESKVEEPEYEVAEALNARGHEVLMIGVRDDIQHLLDRLRAFTPDLVFNCVEAFHDDPHLDYLWAAILESEGCRYTGSGPLGLLATRDKAVSKQILAYYGIRVPGFVTWRLTEEVKRAPDLAFPLIVKPLREDASTGIAQASIVRDVAALSERVSFIHGSFAQPAIAEEFVEGRELYVSILGNGSRLEILPVVEMVFDKRRTKPEERIATRLAKWDVSYRERKGIRNVFARPIARSVKKQIAEICRTAFRALWLRDYARLDIRLTSQNEVWVIEGNANPFISFGHDMANAAEKAGMDYPAFVQRIVDEAMRRYE